jgi:hypothetical protein
MATKRLLKKKMCRWKKRYETKAAAYKIMLKTNGIDLHCYRCDVCGFWHVGHIRKNRRRDKPNEGKLWSVIGRFGAACAIGCYLIMPVTVWGAEMQLRIDGQLPADMICYVSCDTDPNDGKRIWERPAEYPCNALPEIADDCKIIVMSATKPSLENAVRNLRALTGAAK